MAVRKTIKPLIGKKNTLGREEFFPLLKETVDDITHLLSHSYGRTSRYGLVITPEINDFSSGSVIAGEDRLNIYSKDGSHLIQSIQYANSIQTYIKNILVYIGDRVDHACGDGTTTSILFSGNFLTKLIESIQTKNEWWKLFSTVEINQAYDDVVKDLLEVLKRDCLITAEQLKKDFSLTDNEAMWALAYLQSYTSSSGDIEIAKVIAEAFSHIPLDCAENMYQAYPAVEMKTRISLVLDDAQFYADEIGFANPELNNSTMQSEFVSDDVQVLSIWSDIPDEGKLVNHLMDYIDNLEDDQTLIIFTSGVSNRVLSMIRNHNAMEESKVGVIVYGKKGGRFSNVSTELMVLSGLMERPVFGVQDRIGTDNIEDSVCHGASIKISYGTVKLYNLYTPIEGYMGHPGIKHPEDYPVYTFIREHIQNAKNLMQTHHHKKKHEVESIITALADLEYIKRVKIVGGGTTFEQTAIRLVIEDCIAASLSAVNHGVYFNGPSRLFTKCKTLRGRYHRQMTQLDTGKSVTQADKAMQLSLKMEILKSIEAASKILLQGPSPKHRYDYFDTKVADLSLGENDDTTLTLDLSEDVKTTLDKLFFTPPIQPARMFEELFRRTKELCLATALSDHMVTIGEVFELKEE